MPRLCVGGPCDGELVEVNVKTFHVTDPESGCIVVYELRGDQYVPKRSDDDVDG